jgi:teichuronic acid biosynthesis glycosyltransferase TuaH
MSRSNDLHHDDWEGLVVICAGSAWDLWYPAEKHIAALLSRHTPVLYVDPPSPPTSGRFEGLRILNRGLAVLSPRGIPGLTRPILRNAQSVITRRAIARAVQSLGVKRALALVVANHLDLFNAVDADQRIMFATDNFVSGANLMGLDHRYLLAEEKKQAARADRIIVVTERLGDHWRVRGHNPILIPNGCDTERFSTTDCSPWPHDVDLPRPIAGVFGHLSERIDLDLLEAVAERGHRLHSTDCSSEEMSAILDQSRLRPCQVIFVRSISGSLPMPSPSSIAPAFH